MTTGEAYARINEVVQESLMELLKEHAKDTADVVASAADLARAEEREACARIADSHVDLIEGQKGPANIAAAIRARKP